MKLTNKQYDFWKYVAQIAIPAIQAFYFTIASIWKLPFTEEIVASLAAIDLLIGAILKGSSKKYKKQK